MKADDFSTNRLAADVRQTEDLRLKLKQSPREGLKKVAQEFESLFLNMMLKSMRDTLPQDGMFSSDQTRFYTSMLDQQLAQKLSSSGQLGFARLIEQQMGRFLPPDPEGAADGAAIGVGGQGSVGNGLSESAAAAGMSPERMQQALLLARERIAQKTAARNAAQAANAGAAAAVTANPAAATDESAASAGAAGAGGKDFVNRLWPHAVSASQATGVPAHFMVAHAALETGWGKSEIRRADGSPSYNLFGVKAGKGWQGATVDATTTEYVGGVAQTTKEKFRAYGSYAEAFRDYASLLQRPRFAGALGQQDGMEFARSLQQAGYATDPMYAEKLGRIINGPTLRQALQG
ncbi:flagellar rod assembly protein FlgJ [Azospira sp. I13]|uniref:flagellar assembly peptidoglycan hydrolase FlgJ n=1 Tax=Azospira sp. I13 TaxID=1765050 RepID=UPI000D4EF2D6|nr:flagellar assembly peptidoglycan hydrolase FlgJ [Azospira sp. I13]GBG00723.1 flagellar rod assembly protein FlgJ [Azospira sp. I13]